jgi:hypothetical protein
MTWTSFVFDVSMVVTIICNVVVFYYVLPAYRRTKNRAFMWLTISSLLGIFGSVMLHTIGRQHLSHNDYIAYYTLRNLTYFIEAILGTVGLVQLTCQLTRVPEDPGAESDTRSS